jgi:predicted  nucleic acid-binding Zn-ribbon protein
MLPLIQELLVLQERDERVNHLQAELTHNPLEVAALEAKWKDWCNSLLTLENTAKQNEVERKKLALEAATTRDKIAKYKTQQQQTRKNEEYQALIHEITHAEEKISEIEDQELALMESGAELDRKVAAERASLKEREKEVQQRRLDLATKKTTLETQLVTALEQQKVAESTLDATILNRYRRILGSKKTKAIVPVENGVCGGCHMKLTPQTSHSVKASRELIACDNCGRLIYSQE